MGWTTTDEISRRCVSDRSVTLAQSSDFEFFCEIKGQHPSAAIVAGGYGDGIPTVRLDLEENQLLRVAGKIRTEGR
jgi:hypothetical protein